MLTDPRTCSPPGLTATGRAASAPARSPASNARSAAISASCRSCGSAFPAEPTAGYLESNSIALLSRLSGGLDQPSASWLGRHAERPEIRESGLWNVHHVFGRYDPAFLRRLDQLINQQT